MNERKMHLTDVAYIREKGGNLKLFLYLFVREERERPNPEKRICLEFRKKRPRISSNLIGKARTK